MSSLSGSRGNHDGVVVRKELRGCLWPRSVDAALYVDSAGTHEIDAALHHVLGQLHVGNAIHQKTAGMVVALYDGHLRSLVCKLPCAGKACWSRANHSDTWRALWRRTKRKRAMRSSPLIIGYRALVITNRCGLII